MHKQEQSVGVFKILNVVAKHFAKASHGKGQTWIVVAVGQIFNGEALREGAIFLHTFFEQKVAQIVCEQVNLFVLACKKAGSKDEGNYGKC